MLSPQAPSRGQHLNALMKRTSNMPRSPIQISNLTRKPGTQSSSRPQGSAFAMKRERHEPVKLSLSCGGGHLP
eukprot:429039-Prorocentrum_lima.AAC.1